MNLECDIWLIILLLLPILLLFTLREFILSVTRILNAVENEYNILKQNNLKKFINLSVENFGLDNITTKIIEGYTKYNLDKEAMNSKEYYYYYDSDNYTAF